jgi:NADPH:quinone reductase
MRAVGIRSFGDVDVLEVSTVADPVPGAGEACVKVAYAGVNRIDVDVRRGSFASAGGVLSAPLLLGYEGAGEVEAVGSGVTDVAPGDRVAWCCVPGSHAERAVVPVWRLVKVPEAMPLDIACALQLDGVLAHALTVSAFPVRAGDWLLIQGAAEGVGPMLIRIAKALDARVVAVVRREIDATGPRAAGADAVVVSSDGAEIVRRVRETTGGQGCNAVFDGVGRDTIDASIASCRRRGVVVLYGASSGAVDSVSPDALATAGSIFLTRLHLPDFMQDETEVRWRTGDLFAAWAAGRLEVNVGRILPLDGAREAHLALEAPIPSGKILLRMAG